MNNFYQWFVASCVCIDQSPSFVARKIGISSTTVSHWKEGAVPSEKTILKIADYFGIKPDIVRAAASGDIPEQAEPKKKDGPGYRLVDVLQSVSLAVSALPYQKEADPPPAVEQLFDIVINLSPEGQQRILQYAEDLAASGRYAKKDDTVSGIA